MPDPLSDSTQPAIVLVAPQLAENIGTAARAMANFGLIDLRLVDPRDGWPNEKARAAASGADQVIDGARVYGSLAEAIAGLSFVYAATARVRDMATAVVGPHEAALQTRSRAPAGTGFLFGREKSGLTNEEISLADAILTFPVDPGFSSLNIAQAVLLVAYEWRIAGFAVERAGLPFDADITPAPREQLIAMFEHLERALDEVGFFRPPERRPHLTVAIRAMLQRAGLTEQEVRTLRGMIAALERRPTRPHVLPGWHYIERAESGVTILVFDSGIGGLSVAREIRAALPLADMIYVADDAHFPYGDWQEAALTDHVVALVGDLIGQISPSVVVIACNTASTLVLPALRARHQVPFVGTVPAVKPAAQTTRTGHISVLGTFGTMQRDYTRALIEEHAGKCHVRLVGSGNLALLAEAHMRGEAVDDATIWAEIEPAFVERDGKRTDVIVLACTHYPFLIQRFRQLAPWPVTWIDPAPAIARRVASLLGDQVTGDMLGRAYLTSGNAWPASLASTLAAVGLIT